MQDASLEMVWLWGPTHSICHNGINSNSKLEFAEFFLKTSQLAQPFKDISRIHFQTGKRAKPYIKMKPRLRTWILIQRIKSPMWPYLNSSIVNPSHDYTHNRSKRMKEKKKGKTIQATLILSEIKSDCYFRVYDLKWEWIDIKSLIAF